jgi:4-hydroxy-tetrahydrodipicolinate synthase
MLSGSIPAVVTPFAADGSVAEGALREHVERLIEHGSSAVVACGTTGEAPTLTAQEHTQVVRACVEQAAGRVPVVAGAGSNDTRVAAQTLRAVADAGADAALVVAPAYNRPSQDGIYQHFTTLARGSALPMLVYNVPSRTVTDVEPAALARIVTECPDVVIGIKDSSGDLTRVGEHRARLGPNFLQLTGNDELALAFNTLGGIGCISVTANVAPRLCADLQAASRAGDHDTALSLQDRLAPLHAALFSDASPGPVKYALTRLVPGFPPALRLPITWPSPASRTTVDSALAHAGLL